MAGPKRPLPSEGRIPEEGSAAKRQRVSMAPVATVTNTDSSKNTVRPGDFDSLPNELQLAIALEVTNLPNRRNALEGLSNLRRSNHRIDELIGKSKELQEQVLALQKHPGVESRYVALCHDVVSGIPVKDALRQNGPLPKKDRLSATDVNYALTHAGPPQLADLAKEFSGREGSAIDVTFLKGVAYRMATTSTLRRSTLDEAATFAKAFSRHTDIEFVLTLSMLGSELTRGGPSGWPQGNIQQIATLADAFGAKDGANYANRAVALLPQADVQMYTVFVNNFGRSASRVIETLALTVSERHNNLLPQANIRQFTTLADAFCSHGGSNFNDAMERLASQLTMRRDDLLPRASAEQLATMKEAFGGRNGQKYPQVLATIISETEQRSLNGKLKLNERVRSDERALRCGRGL